MQFLLSQIDLLIRGEFTHAERLRQARIEIPSRALSVGVILLGALYGFCMALFGTLRGEGYGLTHTLLVMVKVPALFLLTLAVTCPSLYVFSAIARSRLGFRQTLRLLLAATAVSLTVLASFGPVTAFFTFSTKSHAFMQILNFVVFAASGCVGLVFLHQALSRVFETDAEPVEAAEDVPRPVPTLHRRGSARRIFFLWTLIYGTVGAQMGWILRPFIGAPHVDAETFRATESNIFEGILEALRYL
ncbi:MAG: hypothetical protein GY711_19480 [bacterium]|nr:hypothetical protein [bacterium]